MGKSWERSAKNIVDEIEMLKIQYRAREICFDDDTFTIDEGWVKQVCQEIKRRKLNMAWSCFGRAGLSKGTLKEMKESGCELIRYGVESGDEDILKRAKKATHLNQIRQTFQLTRELGIKTYGTFLLGLHRTLPDVERR